MNAPAPLASIIARKGKGAGPHRVGRLRPGVRAAAAQGHAAPFDDTLSKFYEAHSLDLAHGRNIVNVIIVDFRGLDTLGEIAVVMVAGLAILALIRVRAPVAKSRPEKEG